MQQHVFCVQGTRSAKHILVFLLCLRFTAGLSSIWVGKIGPCSFRNKARSTYWDASPTPVEVAPISVDVGLISDEVTPNLAESGATLCQLRATSGRTRSKFGHTSTDVGRLSPKLDPMWAEIGMKLPDLGDN